MSRNYKRINKTTFTKGNLTLVAVRDEDKYAIREWRNDQIDILRQGTFLTLEEQESYFKNIIDKLFEQEEPSQFIFSLLEDNILIGYGGLVHIDWKNKTAEISFLTETARNTSKDIFINDWVNYLSLLKEIANTYLNFNAIYTYAYDLRPNLYVALEMSGFSETERLKNYVEINGEKKDVVIHTLFLNPLIMNVATADDVDLYFAWANDPEVRKFSFQQDIISYETHVAWFTSKINDPHFAFYLFKNTKNEAVGQVRINKAKEETIVGISIDVNHRGLGHGKKMLVLACNSYLLSGRAEQITAYIKSENKTSVTIFKKAGFVAAQSSDETTSSTIKLILQK